MKPGDMVRFVGDRSCIGVVLSISPIPDAHRDSAGIEPINAVAVLWNECPGLLGGGARRVADVVEDHLEVVCPHLVAL